MIGEPGQVKHPAQAVSPASEGELIMGIAALVTHDAEGD